MSVKFVVSTGASESDKKTEEGTFNKVVAVSDNVVVTMEGTSITDGTDITFPKTLEIEELMSKVVVSNGTVALYTY